MEAINVQLEKIMFELESTYWQKKEQLVEVNIEMKNCTHKLGIHIQTLRNSPRKTFQPIYMDIQLKEFE